MESTLTAREMDVANAVLKLANIQVDWAAVAKEAQLNTGKQARDKWAVVRKKLVAGGSGGPTGKRKAAAVDDGDDNEEVPPPKKAKAATGKGNKGKKSSVEKQDEDAAEDFDGADAMA